MEQHTTQPANPSQPAWWPHVRHLGPTANAEPTLVDDETLPSVWFHNWAKQPDRGVLADERWYTGGELAARVAAAQRELTTSGVAPNERVLLSAPNGIGFVVAHAAILGLGAITVPVNGAYLAGEVAHIVRDCEPVAAVVGEPTWKGWIAEASPTTAVLPIGAVDEPSGAATKQGRSTNGPAGCLCAAPTVAPAPHDPAMIGYTSGTTGRPKGAVLTHANLLASVRALSTAWRWTADDVLILTLPLFHMHGLGVGLHGTLTLGAKAALLDGFSPARVLRAIAAHDATMFFGVPTMYQRLVDEPGVEAMGELRLCVSGSAPLAAQLHRRFTEATGQAPLERYGMTETAMLVSNPYDGERRAGTVGFPLPGVELRLDDAGEVQVRGPNVFAGYWRRPDDTSAAFTDDRWFATGDLGSIDDDGYVRLVGRSKELIISGGFNVYPREVEEVVAQHPEVAECAVAGVPDAHWGEAVAAWVVSARELGIDEVRAFVGERLAKFKRPQHVFRVEQLPRNQLGKIQRHLLTPPAEA